MKKFKIKVNGEVYGVEVEEISSYGFAATAVAPALAPVAAPPPVAPVPVVTPKLAAAPKLAAPSARVDGAICAPMPGTALEVNVKVGDTVNAGQVLLTLEAMKMENELTAGKAGIVKEVRVTKGQAVKSGDVLIVIG